MGQINVGKGNIKASNTGSIGYTATESGKPAIVDENGVVTELGTNSENPQNVIANLGTGLEADLPTGVNAGDIYVTIDTFKVYTAIDSITYNSYSLLNNQFVTDVSETTELPPLYQFYNNILMPIANYKPNELPNLPE